MYVDISFIKLTNIELLQEVTNIFSILTLSSPTFPGSFSLSIVTFTFLLRMVTIYFTCNCVLIWAFLSLYANTWVEIKIILICIYLQLSIIHLRHSHVKHRWKQKFWEQKGWPFNVSWRVARVSTIIKQLPHYANNFMGKLILHQLCKTLYF